MRRGLKSHPSSPNESMDTSSIRDIFTKHDDRRTLKTIVLFVTVCLIPFGIYYCYDMPGSLNEQMRHWYGYNFDEWQIRFNALYSIYSFPNLIIPLISGILVDSLGASRIMFYLSILVCAGQALITLSMHSKSYPLLILGRFIMGLGGESLEVAQARLIVELFSNRYTGFALGLNLSFARIAGALNDWLSPSISDLSGNPLPASILGLWFCGLSLVCVFALMEKNKEKNPFDYDDSDQYQLLVDDSFTTNETTGGTAGIRWKNVFSLPIIFYVLCCSVVFLYGSVNPFIHILSAFLQNTFQVDDRTSGMLMSIPDLISAFASPIFGFILDQISNKHPNIRRVLYPLSGVLIIISHCMFSFTSTMPAFGLILIGLAYSLFGSVLWPLVPEFVTDQKLLGTAYGFSSVALNMALTVVPMIVGNLVKLHGYFSAEVLFISLAIIGTALSIAVVICNLISTKSKMYLELKNDENCYVVKDLIK